MRITWIDHQNTAVRQIDVVHSITKSGAHSALARIDQQKCWVVRFLTEFAPKVSGQSQINRLDDRLSAPCTFALSWIDRQDGRSSAQCMFARGRIEIDRWVDNASASSPSALGWIDRLVSWEDRCLTVFYPQLSPKFWIDQRVNQASADTVLSLLGSTGGLIIGLIVFEIVQEKTLISFYYFIQTVLYLSVTGTSFQTVTCFLVRSTATSDTSFATCGTCKWSLVLSCHLDRQAMSSDRPD